MVTDVHTCRERVVVPRRILTVLLRTHGAVAVVALCPRSTPVPPSPLWRVSVSLDYRSDESSITDNSSVLMAVFISFISFVIQVGHSH